MTYLEALKSTVNYPIDDLKLEKALTDQGIHRDEPYQSTSKEFELATATIYVLLVTSANVAEGGYQISMTDKGNLIDLASGIYSKWGVPNPLKAKPVIRNRSNYW